MIDMQNQKMIYSFFAIFIPIIIHFLIRKKSKQIAFPSIFFLKDTIKKKYKKIKFHQFLLLILRIFIVFFLCLSFIEPTVKVPRFLASNLSISGNYAIIIDTSLSMRVKTNKSTIFNEMKTKALDFIETLPQGSRITIYTTSNNGEIFKQPFSLATSRFISDADSQIECGYDNANLLNVYKRAESLLSKTNSNENDIVIFSDFQKKDTIELQNYLDNNIKFPTLFFFPIEDTRFSLNNLYIKRSNIPFISYLNRQTIPVELELSSNSSIPLKGMYSINVNDKVTEEATFSCSDENSFIKTFLTERKEDEDTIIEFKLNGDDFTEDNIHFSTFNGPPLIKILKFESEQYPNLNHIEKALDPFKYINKDGKTPFIITKTTSLKSKTEIESSDIILIPDPLLLSEQEIDNIKEAIFNGKNAIISFNKLESIEEYNNLLFTPFNEIGSLLTSRIETIIQSPNENGFKIELSEEGKKFFNIIEPKNYWQFCFAKKILNFKAPQKTSRTLLQTENNQPICTLNSYGQGQIVFFLTCMKPNIFTLISEPVFIPFIHKMIDILTVKSRRNIFTEIGSKYYIKNTSSNTIIQSPLGKKFPNKKDALNNSYFTPQTPGIYKIFNAKKNIKFESIAANPPHEESILNYTKMEDINTKNNNKIFIAKTVKEASTFVSQQKGSLALWRILLWMLIILLISEIIIINKLKP